MLGSNTFKKDGFIGIFKLAKVIFGYIPKFFNNIYLYLKLKKEDNYKNKTKDEIINFAFETSIIMQEKYEISKLYDILKKENIKSYLEIGSAKGGTLFVISKAINKNAEIVSLDLPGGRFGGGSSLLYLPIFKRLVLKTQKLHQLRGNSHDKKHIEILKNIYKNKIDLLFIDGDHTYTGVKKDFEMYSPLIRKGGLILFHDIAKHPKETECNVHKFWNEIKNKYKHTELITSSDQKWAGIGILYY